MGVVVDWAGVARNNRELGGEANYLLLFKGGASVEVLDSVLWSAEFVEEEDPTNGGWEVSPQGPVLELLVLGELEPWLTAYAERLGAVGVSGTITGVRKSVPPAWARDLENYAPKLGAMWLFVPGSGGAGDPEMERVLLDRCAEWVGGEPLVYAALPHAGTMRMAPGQLRGQLERSLARGYALAYGFDRKRGSARHALMGQGGDAELLEVFDPVGWRGQVEVARERLLSVPLAGLGFGLVGPQWMLYARSEKYVLARALLKDPGLSWEFMGDPVGVMVLTDAHLAKAVDLSGWVTRRLDESHHLVEARDLGPWYSVKPVALLGSHPLEDSELVAAARRDFGGAVLTVEVAKGLGLWQPPPPM